MEKNIERDQIFIEEYKNRNKTGGLKESKKGNEKDKTGFT